MAKGKAVGTTSSPPAATPTAPKPSLSSQSSKNQKSILGFFQSKTPGNGDKSTVKSSPVTVPPKRKLSSRSTQDLTPVPSSDGPGEDDDLTVKGSPSSAAAGLPSPIDSTNGDVNGQTERQDIILTSQGTPTRKAKKDVNYAESATEDDDEEPVRPFRKSKPNAGRQNKRRKVSDSSDDDNYDLGGASADESDGIWPCLIPSVTKLTTPDADSFIVPDDSEDEPLPKGKRKRASKTSKQRDTFSEPEMDEEAVDMDADIPDSTSTARQWTYDPDRPGPLQPRSTNTLSKRPNSPPSGRKQKAHMTEPNQRYTWLADIRDIDGNKIGDKDYDPRTLYIPPLAWTNFSPFEKQYWEIKQKLWDTVVFFKKGKFYELYENDATIGHQLFDLKLTDRVNMRMVGVPEMSLDHWANQFVAKGFKIARVDQRETALGKDLRERDEKANGGKKKKEDKVIRRELACVLTAGTLVDGSMLQDDMATYCVSIKESQVNGQPAFGIVFVDTATGQFQMTQFVDDLDLTKFETFVAQTRPQELLLEKGEVSAKALRILKNNTGLTTIWNYLKPGKEFWESHITIKEIDASDYFPESWPKALEEAKDKELLMSAFGALLGYLRLLKIERDLVTIGNFAWYDPIRKASSLVLDGQTLINLEIFANSFDGGLEGTLFQLLNRCITPFGKRMFKQWVCHPLMDTKKINARLDAVESLNADSAIRDRFSSQMTKMPDLERLISRIHAGSVKAQDFVRVLEGFEQIDYTMSILQDSKSQSNEEGEGVIGQLIAAMPDLRSRLEYWKTAFDRSKAKEHGILVPERGIEEDFDDSQDTIESVQEELNDLLKRCRKELGSSAVCYRDNGKEIFQLEVPVKVKGIPKSWDQMSATKQVKRYYFPELKGLVRKLQEAQELHSQIVKEVASRFYTRFDENYEIWLAAVKIIAQLDCLISLAKASMSLGQPSCRPEFVESSRSVLDLQDLRHPCLLSNVDDFIPNDINLGGSTENITLLTGANAAGKSTILRMTCVAVIMAQIGCYLPCSSATLTPFDRIMSRLGANDHIFAAQSTFFVELAETKKILSEATPRSLVILDELGRGTSSHDGVAVAQAVLHHLATHVGCLGFFATHYHSLYGEFASHPEINAKRMSILVDDENRQITFLYKLEAGVAEGSFGMHCAAMCGIREGVIQTAEVAAREWEHTSRLGKALMKKMEVGDGEDADSKGLLDLGMLSDVAAMLKGGEGVTDKGLDVLMKCIERL